MNSATLRTALSLGMFLLAACGEIEDSTGNGNSMVQNRSDKELIVLAAPMNDDPYYAGVADDIFNFHITYARRIQQFDDVLILTDNENYQSYADAVGVDAVAVAPMADIWVRDYGLADPKTPIMFRYTAAGQGGGRKGQQDADAVQDDFAGLIEAAGLTFPSSDLLNDGGNFVSDGNGRAVLSRKFLRDNQLSEEAARNILRQKAGLSQVAFIEADEQGGLEHADGVVAFIEPNTLVINSYPEDLAYAVELRASLEAGLPGVVIHEITTPHDGTEVHDERFGSACGLYTNMLVTPHRIYLPQFGIPEDRAAVESLQQWTDKTIVPVPSGDICAMGGGVRCMSWQLRGENAARLKDWAAKQQTQNR